MLLSEATTLDPGAGQDPVSFVVHELTFTKNMALRTYLIRATFNESVPLLLDNT
jgi:hypothetical protein